MKYLTFFFFTFAAMHSSAQNTIRPNMYYHDMNFYNPASGSDDTAQKRLLSVYYKFKLNEEQNDVVWSKPANIFLNHIGTIGKKSFYSVSYIYDKYSFYTRNTLYAGYGKQYKVPGNAAVSVGGRAVLNFNKIKEEKIGFTGAQNIPGSKATFDIDLGVQYQGKHLTLGLSGKNLLGSSVKVEDKELIRDWREIYINASYSIGLINRNIQIAPFVLFVSERDIEMDAGVNLTLFKRVDVSYALRIFELRSVASAKYKISKNIQVGIAFDKSSAFTDNNLDACFLYRFR